MSIELLEFGKCSCGDAVHHAMNMMPGSVEIGEVAEFFKLCGDPTRVGILCALSRHELCVSEIAEVLGMSSSAVSHQLRLLKQTDIVRSHRSGKTVFYSISEKHIEQIFNLALEHAEEKQ